MKNFFEKTDIRHKFQEKFSSKNYEYGRYKPVSFDKIYVRGGIVGGAQWVGASVDPKGIMYVTSNNIAYGTQIEKLKIQKNLRRQYIKVNILDF